MPRAYPDAGARARNSAGRARIGAGLGLAFAGFSGLGMLATSLGHRGAGEAAPGDILLAASVLVGVAAVAFIPGGPRYVAGLGRTLVDGLIVGSSLLLVGWQAGVGDLYKQHATGDYRLVLAHAVGYVVIFSMVLVMATRARPEACPRLVRFAAGFGCLAAADAASAWSRLTHPGAVTPLAALAWGVGWAVIALIALRAPRSWIDEAPGLPTRASVFVPSVPFAVALAAVAAEAADGGGFDPFVAWSGLAVALLIVARQVLALLENISFWRDLEAKIEARTLELRRSEARFRSLVQNSSDVITVVDEGGAVRYQSPSVRHVFGYPKDEVESQGLFRLLHPDDLPKLLAALAEAREDFGGTRTLECRIRHRGGAWRNVEVVTTNLLQDADVEAFVLNVRDITERKALEEQLTHLAFHDPLTGLANRALFNDRLNHALVRRGANEIAVLFLDLDDFKTVNDTLGHGPGDDLLVAVGGRLRNCLRPSDTVARPGGDEFAILLEEVDDHLEPARAADRLLRAFGEPFDVEGQTVFIRASVGIATTPSGGESAEELVRNADIAMYTAKAEGKGMYEVFESGMHGAVVERMQLETDLRQALERDELHLEYQPIVSLATERVTGVEALLRWRHPKRGLVPPADFIPIAERSGMILAIGRWVLESACRQTRDWQERYRSSPPLSVSVNLSARQLREPALADEVARATRVSGLHPSTLLLEITESVLIEDADEIVTRLEEVRAMGIKIAIDDFGTGYSSLSYLRRFKLDALKIDRSFIAGLTEGSQESALASAIVAMGHALGLRAVAEGIETLEQLEVVRGMGCDLAQGYYFATPLSAEEVEPLLSGAVAAGPVDQPTRV